MTKVCLHKNEDCTKQMQDIATQRDDILDVSYWKESDLFCKPVKFSEFILFFFLEIVL